MDRPRDDVPAAAPASLGRSAPFLRWAWLPVFVVLFAPTVAWLWSQWTRTIWINGHGLFVPLIAGYLVYDHLKRRPLRETPRGSAWGFCFLVPGLAMIAADAAIHTELLAAAGLVACLPGFSLLLLGTDRTRALAFPLVLTPFMLPVPLAFVSSIHLVLRSVTAFGTAHVVDALGIPVLRQATLLHIPNAVVQVADVCSGFSTLYAAITLSLILCYLTQSAARRVVILLVAPVLAIACNSVRVSALVLLVYTQGPEILETNAHELSGIISFGVTLVLLFAVAGRDTVQGRTA